MAIYFNFSPANQEDLPTMGRLKHDAWRSGNGSWPNTRTTSTYDEATLEKPDYAVSHVGAYKTSPPYPCGLTGMHTISCYGNCKPNSSADLSKLLRNLRLVLNICDYCQFNYASAFAYTEPFFSSINVSLSECDLYEWVVSTCSRRVSQKKKKKLTHHGHANNPGSVIW